MAKNVCKTNYATQEYIVFFESLLYLVEYEKKAYDALGDVFKAKLTQEIYDAVD